MIKYENLPDNKLCELAKTDIQARDYLIRRYIPLIKKISHRLFLTGAEKDDVLIEGMLGLDRAIETYDESKSSFITHCTTCIRNAIYDAIKSANTKKNMPLNTSINILKPSKDEDDDTFFIDLLSSGDSPETNTEQEEDYQKLVLFINENFSDDERAVLNLYLDGLTYSEIALQLEIKPKKVDNTIQKIKNKISKCK